MVDSHILIKYNQNFNLQKHGMLLTICYSLPINSIFRFFGSFVNAKNRLNKAGFKIKTIQFSYNNGVLLPA